MRWAFDLLRVVALWSCGAAERQPLRHRLRFLLCFPWFPFRLSQMRIGHEIGMSRNAKNGVRRLM